MKPVQAILLPGVAALVFGVCFVAPALASDVRGDAALGPSSSADLGAAGAVKFKTGLLSLQALSPQAEKLQHYADYTKDRQVYQNHKVEQIGLSVFFAALFIWFYGFELIVKLRGDPLPVNVRAAFDRLDAVRLALRGLALGAKAAKADGALSPEAETYNEIAEGANLLLGAASAGLRSVALDEAALILKIEQLTARANALSARLMTMQPSDLSAAEIGDRIRFGLGFINRVNRGWRRAFASRNKLKAATVEQLHEMRWPPWSAIKGLTG